MKQIEEETVQLDHYKLHLIPSKKYKTITIVAKMNAPLNRETITQRVLLPSVLRQGTKHYPSREALQFKLDDLYGASLSLDSRKSGSHHILNVRMQVANQKYIGNESSIISDAIELLNEVIFNPYVVDGGLNPSIVEREKKTLDQHISSIIDDKDSYAQMRLIDHMCKGENYQIHSHGYQEDLGKITPESLYDYYQTLLTEDVLDIYVLGDFDHADVTKHMKEKIERKGQAHEADEALAVEDVITHVEEVKDITEYQDVKQAKLHLGYRTGITYQDDAYPGLLIFNGIFGGYPGSKLFLNVREKHSLAYSVGSGAESYNGLMFVVSGIAASDYEQARAIIEKQLEAMRNGDFTDKQVEELKVLMIGQLLETMDSAQGMIELLYRNILGGRDRSLTVLMEEIQAVTKTDVIEIANKVQLDTVYLLTSKEETV